MPRSASGGGSTDIEVPYARIVDRVPRCPSPPPLRAGWRHSLLAKCHRFQGASVFIRAHAKASCYTAVSSLRSANYAWTSHALAHEPLLQWLENVSIAEGARTITFRKLQYINKAATASELLAPTHCYSRHIERVIPSQACVKYFRKLKCVLFFWASSRSKWVISGL